VEIAPEFLPSLLHLGSLFEAAGDKMQASHYQCRAYVLPPMEGKSWEMVGISFYFLGRLEEAAQAYRAWLASEPDNPIAAHMLAACSQLDVPRAPRIATSNRTSTATPRPSKPTCCIAWAIAAPA
jgi:predicted TPR repeat methyltransferase